MILGVMQRDLVASYPPGYQSGDTNTQNILGSLEKNRLKGISSTVYIGKTIPIV